MGGRRGTTRKPLAYPGMARSRGKNGAGEDWAAFMYSLTRPCLLGCMARDFEFESVDALVLY